MHTLNSHEQFEHLAQHGNAIIFVDFKWSGQAQLSRLVVSEWERTWAVWNPRVRIPIWRVSPDEQPWFTEWLPKDRGDLAGGGHGAVLWLRGGQIVGHEGSAYGAGIRELARRTDELFGESGDELAKSVNSDSAAAT